MSYILDALRKADAERERGHVPGIHAQPSFGGAAPVGTRAAPWPRLWIATAVLVVALLIALLIALGWSLLGGGSRGSAVVPTPTPVAVVAPAAAPPTPAVLVPPAAPRPEPAPVAVAVARKPKPVSPALPVATAARTDTNPAVPAASASNTNRVYAVNELPDDIRRQLPTVSVGGSMYSATAANRILIINGQVLHEGDKIAPELLLQQIKPKAAVLAFRGYRYTIGF